MSLSMSSPDLTADNVYQELSKRADPEKAAFFPRFFKSGKGQYGEGDRFLGVVVPEQRKVAKAHRNMTFPEISKLLDNEFHELRLTGIFILVEKYERAKTPERKSEICDFYLSKLDRVNNWDLVDSSAHKILGPELRRTGRRELLFELAASGHLWRERVAIISTLHFTKFGEFSELEKLCESFLDHPHDLIHKACGWMLREAGKRDVDFLRSCLQRWSKEMPRTMLRYSIEKLDKSERRKWMA